MGSPCTSAAASGISTAGSSVLRLTATLLGSGLFLNGLGLCSLCFLFSGSSLGSLLFSKQTINGRLLLSLFLLGLGVQILTLCATDGIHLVGILLGYAGAFALGGRNACSRVLCSLVQNGIDDTLQLIILRHFNAQFAGYLHEFGDRKTF